MSGFAPGDCFPIVILTAIEAGPRHSTLVHRISNGSTI